MMNVLLQAVLIALPVYSWDKNKDQCKIKVDVNATQEALCCQSLGIISNKIKEVINAHIHTCISSLIICMIRVFEMYF